ncbi:uncharacterized protein LY89DRAFT_784831 [Mollisia scopiformis]|uniref:Uncharacterized protein n=1 Tax=Mollisia scopiformis TaxID=149040 RepID=A0A194X204_MOLSC|nr:uncharacterized protein LY89DRAFT_784831 [Mollisia scopiformis]KUJ14019.1 hypothetical protein LY89DRAFT_784831 [Mollisia scopiformis]
MDADSSYLSKDPTILYDFVVSTTQASISSGLFEYIHDTTQPITYLCFLVDGTGNPTIQISLSDLLAVTGGVNPFDIEATTPYNDPRIGKLTAARFNVGIKLQIGMPPGCMPPSSLPPGNVTILDPILTLGNSTNNVLFNMYCSELSVIQNTPGSWGDDGQWNIFNQPYGTPWYIQTRVDLIMPPLPIDLSNPYFSNHPDQKAALLAQLEQMSISGLTFSLQQLLLDLENSTLETPPSFSGIPLGPARTILESTFRDVYAVNASNHGAPILSIAAIPSDVPDTSSLQMTSFQRQVSQQKDAAGNVLPIPLDPTLKSEQEDASTLDFVCMTQNRSLPQLPNFAWNWVLPVDVDNESGVVAIRRESFAQFLVDEIVTAVTNCCLALTCTTSCDAFGGSDYHVDPDLEPYRTPLNTFSESGPDVINIAYSGYVEAYSSSGATETGYVYDTTIIDTYTITVGQNGDLSLIKQGESAIQDNSDPGQLDGFLNFFKDLNGVVDNITHQIGDWVGTNLEPVDFNSLPRFVFPGASVFTYKSVSFSQYQDLICEITYVTPSGAAAVGHSATTSSSRPKLALPESESEFEAADPPTDPTPTTTLTSSSDLILNYVQGEIVSPTSKFEALQVADGHSLLFAIDTSNVFHVIEEQTATISTGWKFSDLSTALIEAEFPATDAIVRTFDVGQSAVNGNISLAMAVSSEESDNLYVSLANSSSDASWIAAPISETPPTILTIVGVLFAEILESQECLVVDIYRPSTSGGTDIECYYIDPTKFNGTYWVKHDVPIDIEAGSYQSCIGRTGGDVVDGIYTSGVAGTDDQLIYTPILNAWGHGPPTVSRLIVPSGNPVSAIATARNADSTSPLYGTTDLYAVSNSALYRFAADAQGDNASGAVLVTSEVLSGCSKLLATSQGGVTTLWGKNASDEIFYISCLVADLADRDSWSIPIPILSEIENVSAYVNKADGGKTIFAAGNGLVNLQKIVQATDSTTKIWRTQQIILDAPIDQKALSFNSYTTVVQLSENNQPAAGATLVVSTDSRTPMYASGIYYVLGLKPAYIKTNASGSMIFIEATDDLQAAIISIDTTSAGPIVSAVINPMEQPFQKITSLNSSDLLRGASFPSQTVASGVVGTPQSTSLIAASTSGDAVDAIVNNTSSLTAAYSSLSPNLQAGIATAPRTKPSSLNPDDNFVDVFIGDLVRWLKSGVSAIIQIVQDAATETWHFIANIAGQAYRAIMDTVKGVVGAIEWVFDAIKTGIEDLIRFLEFLFGWDDIQRTKDILHNVASLFLEDQIASIDTMEEQLDASFAAAEATMNEWAGTTDWSPLGPFSSQTPVASDKNAMQGQTASSQMLTNHYHSQSQNMSIIGGPTPPGAVDSLMDELLTAISNKGAVLGAVYDQLEQLATQPESAAVDLPEPLIEISEQVQQVFASLLHFGAGIVTIFRLVYKIPEAKAVEANSPTARYSTVLGIVATILSASADRLAPKYAIQNEDVIRFSLLFKALGVCNAIRFSGYVSQRFYDDIFGPLTIVEARSMGAVMDSILAACSFIVTCYHFKELFNDPENSNRMVAMEGEAANFFSYCSRLLYAGAVAQNDPVSRPTFVAFMAGCDVLTAGFEVATAFTAM